MQTLEQILEGLRNPQAQEEEMLIAQLLNPAAQQKRMNPAGDLFDLSGVQQPAQAVAKPVIQGKKAVVPQKKQAVAPVVTPETQGQLVEPEATPMSQDLQPQQGISAESLPSLSESDQEYLARQTPGMRQQRETLDLIRNMIGTAEPEMSDTNLTSILGFSDILTGSNFMSKYKTPKQQKHAATMDKVNALMGLSKEQGSLAQDEINLFNATNVADIKKALGLSEQDFKRLKLMTEEGGKGTRQTETEEQKMLRLKYEEEQKNARARAAIGAKNKGGGLRQVLPGYTHDGITEFVKGDIPKLQNALSDSTTMNSHLNNAIALVNGASTKDLLNPTSSVAVKIAQELADAQLTYKGEAFANLGVLTGPDTGYLDNIIIRPRSVKGMIATKAELVGSYKDAIRFISEKLANKVGTRGFSKSEGSVQKSSGGDASAKLKRLQELRAKAGK